MFRLANPNRFMQWSGKLLPVCAVLTTLLIGGGTYLALFVAPPDYQQGDAVRIMYVHVPSAWMSLFVYSTMALASAMLRPHVEPARISLAACTAIVSTRSRDVDRLWSAP